MLGQGRCREHPEREARLTPCARCGDFRCEECFDFDSDVTMCASCVPARVPWVKSRGLGTLWETFALVVTQGPRLFSTAVGTGEPQHASSFAASVGLATAAPIFAIVLVASLLGSQDPATAAGVICGAVICWGPSVVFGQVVRGGIYGFIYHQVARLLGGRAFSTSSYDASYFSMALNPFFALAYVFLLIPILGPFLTLAGFAAIIGWGIHLVAHHAHARHELAWWRAYVAAASPVLVLLAVYAAIIAFAMVRAFERGLDASRS